MGKATATPRLQLARRKVSGQWTELRAGLKVAPGLVEKFGAEWLKDSLSFVLGHPDMKGYGNPHQAELHHGRNGGGVLFFLHVDGVWFITPTQLTPFPGE